MKFQLLPYQKRYIEFDGRRAIWEKSRQIGASWCEALWSVRRRCRERINHYYISQDFESSKRFIKYCHYFTDLLGIKTDSNTECLTFPNGSEIKAMTSSKEGIRGARGDVTCDEFAHHKDAKSLLVAVEPVVTWGGICHLISTHNGYGTEFNRIVEDSKKKKNEYQHFRTDIYDAVADGLALKIAQESNNTELLLMAGVPGGFEAMNEKFLVDLKRGCSNSLVWEQEYLCKAWATGTALVTPELYEACAEDYETVERLPFAHSFAPLYCGVDVGITAFTVLVALEEVWDKDAELPRFKVICVKEMQGATLPTQLPVLKAILAHPSCEKCYVDMGAQGRGISQELKMSFQEGEIPCHVVETALTSKAKQEIAELVRRYVEQKRLIFPADSPAFKNDITSLSMRTTEMGTPSYEGYCSDGSHCDRWWALGLALLGADKAKRLSVSVF